MKKKPVYLYRVPVGFVVSSYEENAEVRIRAEVFARLIEFLDITPHDGSWLIRDRRIEKQTPAPYRMASMAKFKTWLNDSGLRRDQASARTSDGDPVDFHLILRENEPPPVVYETTKVPWGKPRQPKSPSDALLEGVVEEYPGYIGALRYERNRLNDMLMSDELNIESSTATAYIEYRKGGRKHKSLPTDRAKVLQHLVDILDEQIKKEKSQQHNRRRKQPKKL